MLHQHSGAFSIGTINSATLNSTTLKKYNIEKLQHLKAKYSSGTILNSGTITIAITSSATATSTI